MLVWCTGDGPIDPRVFLINLDLARVQGNSWLRGKNIYQNASSEQKGARLKQRQTARFVHRMSHTSSAAWQNLLQATLALRL